MAQAKLINRRFLQSILKNDVHNSYHINDASKTKSRLILIDVFLTKSGAINGKPFATKPGTKYGRT